MDAAAKNGHLDVIKWLYKNRKEGYSSFLLSDLLLRFAYNEIK